MVGEGGEMSAIHVVNAYFPLELKLARNGEREMKAPVSFPPPPFFSSPLLLPLLQGQKQNVTRAGKLVLFPLRILTRAMGRRRLQHSKSLPWLAVGMRQRAGGGAHPPDGAEYVEGDHVLLAPHVLALLDHHAPGLINVPKVFVHLKERGRRGRRRIK